MDNQKEISALFDEWLAAQPPAEQAWCRAALRNTIIKLRNIGPQNARELIVATLLFWHAHAHSSHDPARRD